MNFSESANIPLEVRLAWEVMSCRAMRSTYESRDHSCHWFNKHYGPYPAFSLVDDLLCIDEPAKDDAVDHDGLCVGMRYQIPEIMSGCRKAPIMTIGINPNLTAYYPSRDGATWCYPYFDDIKQYAYYFRHRSICQEQFSIEFVREHAIPGTEIRAEKKGNLIKSSISAETGGINLELKYEGQEQRILYLESGYRIFISPYDKSGFQPDEVIAAKVDFPEGSSTKIKGVKVGYYQRFEKIFNKFKQIAKLDELHLALGEDVCQADMVACASPGWDKWFPDQTRRGIENECVRKRMYLLLQLLQTRPKIIVFSGMSAFSMFYAVMKPYITPILDLNKDTYITLRDSIRDEIRLNIEDNGAKLVSSRLAISPHFSYSDNFRPQYRFSKSEWDEYSKSFTTEFSLLAKIAQPNSDNTCRIIFADDPNAPTIKSIGEDVWKILQEHLFNAEDCIAEIILDEYNKGLIKVEKDHLKRSDGPCRFCSNQLFSFKEGCPYGKLDAQEEIASSLNHVARTVMSNTDKSNTDVIP